MLRVNALAGFGGGGVGPPVSIEGSITGNVSTAAGTVHSMGSFNVGASNSGKRAIMLVTVADGSTFTITDVTVGGVSLTERVTRITTSGEFVRAAIWSGDISSLSGSQAVVITTNTTTSSAGVSGVSVHGLQSLIPVDSGMYRSSSSSAAVISSLSGPNDGIVLVSGGHGHRARTPSWSSLTERADLETGGNDDDHRHTAAWDLGGRASADETITWSISGILVAAGASFR